MDGEPGSSDQETREGGKLVRGEAAGLAGSWDEEQDREDGAEAAREITVDNNKKGAAAIGKERVKGLLSPPSLG